MPLQATSGAASYDAFGGGVAAVPQYIEDVFSTWLYTGTGSAQTITNGIDLAGKGGLVWNKIRNLDDNHYLIDTTRGVTKALYSNATDSQATITDVITSFNSNGFTAGTYTNGYNNVSWTFREAPKFFDVVTWTGTGGSRAISHALASTPGCIIIKRTDAADNWYVVHRSAAGGFGDYGILNNTNAFASGSEISSVNSTSFTVSSFYNGSGSTWVAYLFAHNAGGFGLTGTDNVISCGSFSGNTTVNLGYEPQWVLLKSYDAVDDWYINDNMRGWTNNGANGNDAYLRPNSSGAEVTGNSGGFPTATGFTTYGFGGTNGIYIAIRRGPMKVPTTGTSVFDPDFNASFPQPGVVTTGFVADWDIYKRTGGSSTIGGTRLTGGNYLFLNDTSAETSGSSFLWDNNTGLTVQSLAGSGNSTINWATRRAPGFFDVVCYTGTGTTTTQTHNLAAVPELIIVKRRSGTAFWQVYSAAFGRNFYAFLNDTQGFATDPGNSWGTTDPTSTTFGLSPLTETNASGSTYVAYLFATCPGVSKVGSYTGNGTTQDIACGFTGGARFVLIKRTDASGGWYVYDTARGMTMLTDPYLFLNSTAAETATLGSVITSTGGFTVNAAILAAINTNAASYIFLAIA